MFLEATQTNHKLPSILNGRVKTLFEILKDSWFLSVKRGLLTGEETAVSQLGEANHHLLGNKANTD